MFLKGLNPIDKSSKKVIASIVHLRLAGIQDNFGNQLRDTGKIEDVEI